MSKEDAERVQQTEALQDLMGKKMAIWKEILSAARDMDRKEGLKQYRTMAAEELRIIARNVSKTKLRELTDQKINYFSQIGISDSDDNKIANMQGFRQVGDEERLLCALEAPEVAPRVFPDVALDEASLAKFGTLPPGAFGGQAGPVRKQESFTSLVGDTAVLERLEDQVSILEKAALQSRNGERATPYGGVIRQGVHPPPLPLSPAQLMQQAQMMSARLPKRRLPPTGQSPQVEHKSRLVSEFVEKLAGEIAANRISKSEARKQLKDIVEMENELTETLVSATTVRPDVTEDKLQAIAEMYKEISSTIISNPEMNREEAMNKLKRVAAMEHELTQALVPDEVFPYQQKDESGNKSRRGVGIQELVNEVMATSEEVVQAKRQLQSSDGNPEASVRSMGDLEGKLWKLIDLEVDLVNELARYRWSGDVQDPRAEIKLNNAEEKIWKVIGVQKRLAQDLGEWRKNSTRTFQTRAPDPVAVAQPLSYGYEANYNPVVYGDPANFNPNNRDNMGGYVNSGNQGGSGNPAVSDGRDNPNLRTSREAEESTQPPMTHPKVKKQSSKQSKMSKASKASRKSERSTRASRKKQRKQQSLSNDVSPAATPVKRTKSRKSSKKRSRSRDLSPDTTTSNTTTNTSVQSSGGSTSEYSTDSTDITGTVVTEPDSITIATTIVISSEMDDAEDNQRPSAVSWKSPSKEFLSSIDRSQVTPVEWETKRKGKYIYVRPRQGGTGRKPVRSASHSPPKARKPRAHPNARRHSAGPKDSFELYGTNGSRHGRDHRGHAVDCPSIDTDIALAGIVCTLTAILTCNDIAGLTTM
ncbi:hypothetical protein IscW_ISCW004919 [Ixodes scapularis]|uniref:Uncharacterized protein n=1 Tax=Ixodes scapularis TaxID=6945 RepID=B7PFY5_IXOSC|nr:hypothetical protein IscW_ISCW004919 [Ixodes scapularis]|eukprot:XP_002434107.1 hypothetical protein IscW_ISCW004919 [Ixodes scapularis]